MFTEACHLGVQSKNSLRLDAENCPDRRSHQRSGDVGVDALHPRPDPKNDSENNQNTPKPCDTDLEKDDYQRPSRKAKSCAATRIDERTKKNLDIQ